MNKRIAVYYMPNYKRGEDVQLKKPVLGGMHEPIEMDDGLIHLLFDQTGYSDEKLFHPRLDLLNHNFDLVINELGGHPSSLDRLQQQINELPNYDDCYFRVRINL